MSAACRCERAAAAATHQDDRATIHNSQSAAVAHADQDTTSNYSRRVYKSDTIKTIGTGLTTGASYLCRSPRLARTEANRLRSAAKGALRIIHLILSNRPVCIGDRVLGARYALLGELDCSAQAKARRDAVTRVLRARLPSIRDVPRCRRMTGRMCARPCAE